MTVQTVTVRNRMLIVSGSVIMRTVAVTVMTITTVQTAGRLCQRGRRPW